jgi:type II secretion system protein G
LCGVLESFSDHTPPALKPLVRLAAWFGLIFSPSIIYLGAFLEPPTDHARFRYIMAVAKVGSLAEAAEHYKLDCGAYPSVEVGLKALVSDPGVNGWHGPYISEAPLDPWGRPYIYLRSAGSKPEILSYGADRKPGGTLFGADISSRKPRPPIPSSPLQIRDLVPYAIWIGAWIWLTGSIVVAWRVSRSQRQGDV